MAIYDIDFSLQASRLLPPSKRGARWLAWFTALIYPLQWLRDIFFQLFVPGFNGAKWSSVATYVKGDRVRYIDRKVYEALQAVPANTPPDANPQYWLMIVDVWVGIDERTRYNSQKLFLEYILNKWFESMFRQPTSFVPAPNYYLPKSDIYISDNNITNPVMQIYTRDDISSKSFFKEIYFSNYVINAYSFNFSSFTINVPNAVWTPLAATDQQRETIIRQIADKYVIAGIKYSVINY